MSIYTEVGTISSHRRSHITMGKEHKKEKRPLTSDSDSDSGPEDRGPTNSKMKKFSKGETPKSTSKPAAASNNSFGGEEKDADGNPMWDLGNMKKVCVREFKGKTYVDIREYYVDKNTMDTRPGKKGISMNTMQYQKLKSIMDDIDHALP